MVLLVHENFQVSHTKLNYRPDIDGLRAIAITAVVAFHAGLPFIKGGFVGVDVFFVISGYLITSLLFDAASKKNRLDLIAFYTSRIRRLFPAASLVFIATTVLAYFILTPEGLEQLVYARSAVAGILFFSNIYFWKFSGGYFDTASDQLPLLHTWSLSVEEQFYLCWPLILVVAVKLCSRFSLSLRKLVLAVLTVVFFTSLYISIRLTESSASEGFYSLHSRVWELVAGALASVALYQKLPTSNKSRSFDILAVMGLIAITSAIFFFNASMPFPGKLALIPVLGTVAVIVAGAFSSQGLVVRLLSIRPLVWLGKLSYSWYLWHWPLIVLMKLNDLGEPNLARDIAMSIVALFLAFLTFKYVENPIRLRRPWKFATTKGTFGLGLCLLLLSLLSVATMMTIRWKAPDSPLTKKILRSYKDINPLRDECTQSMHKTLENVNNPKCISGDTSSRSTVAVWGDSHSDQWVTSVQSFFSKNRIIQFSMSGCPPLLLAKSTDGNNCHAFNDQVAQSLQAIKSQGATGLIIAARWPAYAGMPSIQLEQMSKAPGYFEDGVSDPEQALKSLTELLSRTLLVAEKLDIPVVVIAPTPELFYAPIKCLARKSPEICAGDRAANESRRNRVVEALQNAVAQYPNARLAEPFNALCESDKCEVIDENNILFLDGDHLTASGAKKAFSNIKPDLAWLQQRISF